MTFQTPEAQCLQLILKLQAKEKQITRARAGLAKLNTTRIGIFDRLCMEKVVLQQKLKDALDGLPRDNSLKTDKALAKFLPKDFYDRKENDPTTS